MSGSIADEEVVIVGAGPTGLMVALELARRQRRVRLIDRTPHPSPYCRALAVQSRTLELFAQVGLLRSALDAGLIPSAANIYRNGRLVNRNVINPKPWPEVPYPFVLSLEQSQTERILTEQLARLGQHVERGLELVGISQDDSGVIARIRDETGRVEQIRTRYLVACDGSHSLVRRILEIPFEGEDYGHPFLVADVDVEWALAPDESHRFHSGDRALVAWPIDGAGRFYLSGPEASTTGRGDPALDEVQRYVDAYAPSSTVLRNPRWLARYRVSNRIARSYRVGRVFLAGDSAHVHHTTGAQGMNTGLQDAFNLGWKLDLVLSSEAAPALLDSYHAERYPIGREVLETAANAFRNWGKRDRPSVGEKPAPIQSEDIHRAMIARFMQLGLNYRESPIVTDCRTDLSDKRPRLEAGDRAPDGPVVLANGRPSRLFELFAREMGYQLLSFVGASPTGQARDTILAAIKHTQARYGRIATTYWVSRGAEFEDLSDLVDHQLNDPDGLVHASYDAEVPSLYLIRPDGYVGFCALWPDANRLIPYFERTLGVEARA